MSHFLDEIDGGFVVYTKALSEIEDIVSARIYPEAAPLDESQPHLIYTQADGHSLKSHRGQSGERTLAMHVYCISTSQPQANELADLIEYRWLSVDNAQAGDQVVQVCNAGQMDGGQWFANDSSDQKLFYRRVLLRMLITL